MVERARLAQQEYIQQTSFEDRRRMLRSLSAFIVREQRAISNVASRDSGKTCTYCITITIILFMIFLFCVSRGWILWRDSNNTGENFMDRKAR